MERFEDIIAWQKARGLVAEVYGISTGRRLAKDFALRETALSIALGQEFLSQEVFDILYLKENEVSTVISGFLKP